MDIRLHILGMHGNGFVCSLKRSDEGELRWQIVAFLREEEEIPCLPGRREIRAARKGTLLQYHYFDFKESDLDIF